MEDIEMPSPKRPRQSYHHHHRIHHKQESVDRSEPAIIEQGVVDTLLIRAIVSICKEQGLRDDISNLEIDPLALDSFQTATEQFITQLCANIRQSMIAARRTMPIATDFDTAFLDLHVPRPDDQLLAYRSKPHMNPPLYPTPPPDDVFHNHVDLSAEFLGPELSQQTALQQLSFETSALPPLPSAHTYKDTAVFSQRQLDARRIREMATEEGKLGEQALRKLAGAVKLETALASSVGATSQTSNMSVRQGRRVVTISEEAVFEDTMRELLQAESDDFELGPIVTSEKAYRMPDDAQVKRRPAALVPDTTGGGAGASESSHTTGTLAPSPRSAKAYAMEIEL